MEYLFGFLVVTVDTAIYSLANIYDEALSRDVFKSVRSIVVMNGLVLFAALPILYIFLKPGLPTQGILLLIFAVSFLEFAYQIPYYMAMRHDDASVVVSLFSMGKILIPISAYFLANERLSLIQYAGYGLIIVASLMTSFDRKHFRMNKAFYLMIPVVIVLALQTGLEKRALEIIDWKTFYFWMVTASVPFYLALLCFTRMARKEVGNLFANPLKKKYLPLYLQNIASCLAGLVGTFATSLLPVTVVSAFGSFQSLIVHLLSAEEGKWLHVKAELFSWKRVRLCCLIGIGVLLTTVA